MTSMISGPTKSFVPSAAIAQYARVKLASDGTISTAGATDTDIGTAEDAAFSTGINPLKEIAVRLNTSQGTRKMIAGTTFSKGDVVYNAATGKVGSSNNGYIAGIAMDAAVNGGDVCEILHVNDFSSTSLTDHQIATTVVASSAVSTTAVETAFSNGVVNYAANTLAAGDVIRVRLQGIATATNSSDTLTVKLKNGTNVIANTGAVDVANSDIFYIDVDFVIRTAATNGTAVSAGIQALGTPGTVTAKPCNLASSTINTQTVNDFTVTATWNTNNAGNSCRLDIFDVQHLLA